jgi:hypothetical protein
VLGLVSGNPSNVLLLGSGAATLLLARRRYFLGGLLLGTAWIKPPVGLPVAAALIIGFPGGRVRAAMGAVTGTVAFAVLNLAAAGPGRIAQWMVSLVPYSQALSPHSQSLPSQCCLASLPALLLGFMPVSLAVGVSVLAVGLLLVRVFRHPGWPAAWALEPFLLLAILTAAGLAVTPYIHMNDLVLEALPLLILASLSLTALSRLTLATWGLGPQLPLAVAAVLQLVLPQRGASQFGFGIALSTLTLLAITLTVVLPRTPMLSPKA